MYVWFMKFSFFYQKEYNQNICFFVNFLFIDRYFWKRSVLEQKDENVLELIYKKMDEMRRKHL